MSSEQIQAHNYPYLISLVFQQYVFVYLVLTRYPCPCPYPWAADETNLTTSITNHSLPVMCVHLPFIRLENSS